MTKRSFHIFFIIICCVGFQGCPIDFPGMREEFDIYYYLINKSNERIGVFQDGSDTILTASYSVCEPRLLHDKNKRIKFPALKSDFEQGKRLNILVFKESTLSSHSWEQIVENNIYDKLYVLSLEELEAMDYTVVYDGK